MEQRYHFFKALFLGSVAFCCCPVIGQEQKKHITESDYEKWGTLGIKSLSEKGKWASYTMTYENQRDTMFLQNTYTKRQYAFPKGREGRFGGERLFAYVSNEDLVLYSLMEGTSERIKKVKQYEIINGGTHFVVWHTNNDLEIRKADGTLLDYFKEVTLYSLSEKKQSLLYTRLIKDKYEVGGIQFKPYKNSIVYLGTTAVTKLVWQKHDKSVVGSDGTSLFYYRFADKKSVCLSQEELLESGFKLVSGSFGPLSISAEGNSVFFSVKKANPKTLEKQNSSVEVWSGNDEPLFPVKQELQSTGVAQVSVWFPDKGTYTTLSDEALTRVRLSGMQDYAVLSNPHSYSLTPKYYEEVDYYIKNVKTGAEKLLLKKQSHDPNQLRFSPLSNAMVYYRDKNWWLYNPDSDVTLNLSQSIKTTWDTSEDNAPPQFETQGVAGWAADGKSVLVHDTHDIWKMALDGTGGSRLTRGKEQQRIYRVSALESEKVPLRSYEGEVRTVLDLNTDSVFSVESPVDWSSGYAVYNSKTGLRDLIYEPRYISGIKRAKGGTYVYTSQTFSQSPQLHLLSRDRSTTMLYESNKQQAGYYYGKSKLIQYASHDGKVLQGCLLYPADYDSTRTYPMIVPIYEQLSKNIYRYKNPTNHNYEGLNYTNLTLNGYFVLLPDIEYGLGNPAVSATECSTAAVKKVLATENVDAKRIGLIGHSFGGYETNFIITQTDLFAAAVSGAGVSDIVEHYFDVTKSNIHNNEMWRYETQQFRMGTSFYQNKQGYLNNSPILYADKIKTPVLLWAGKNDKVIPFEQSVSFYMALRRLRLPNVLLAYAEEDHTLSNKENQQDLSRRIMEWFEYYLKEGKEVGWIKAGTSYD